MLLKFFGLFGPAAFSLAASTLPRLPINPNNDSIVHSLSLPGFQFRRVEPLVPTSSKKKIQNHLRLRRISTGRPQRSAVALLGQIQRDNGGGSYENVTAVNHYAVEYSVDAIFNGIPMTIVVDSGSADTCMSFLAAYLDILGMAYTLKGIRGSNFTCRNIQNQTISEDACGIGSFFSGNFTDGPIVNEHFTIRYGDGENLEGRK